MTLNVTGNLPRYLLDQRMTYEWFEAVLLLIQRDPQNDPQNVMLVQASENVSSECKTWLTALKLTRLRDMVNQLITHYSGNEQYNAKGNTVPFLFVEDDDLKYNKDFLSEAKAACEAACEALSKKDTKASKRKATDDDSAGAGEAKKQCSSSSLRRTASVPPDGDSGFVFRKEDWSAIKEAFKDVGGFVTYVPHEGMKEMLGKPVTIVKECGLTGEKTVVGIKPPSHYKNKKFWQGGCWYIPKSLLEAVVESVDEPVAPMPPPLDLGKPAPTEAEQKLVEDVEHRNECLENYTPPATKADAVVSFDDADENNPKCPYFSTRDGWVYYEGKDYTPPSGCRHKGVWLSKEEYKQITAPQSATEADEPVSHSLLCEAILTLDPMFATHFEVHKPLFELTWKMLQSTTGDEAQVEALRLLEKAGLLPDVEECDTTDTCLCTSWDSTDNGLDLLDFLNGKPEELTEEVQEFVRRWVLFIVQQKDDIIPWESYELAGTVVENTLKEIREACSFFLSSAENMEGIRKGSPLWSVNPEHEKVKKMCFLEELGVCEQVRNRFDFITSGVPLLAILSKNGTDEDIGRVKGLFCEIGMNERCFNEHLYPALKKDNRLGYDTIVGKIMYEVMEADDELSRAPNRVLQKLCLAHDKLEGEAKLNNEVKQIVALFFIKNDLEDEGRPKTPEQQTPQSPEPWTIERYNKGDTTFSQDEAQYDKSCAGEAGSEANSDAGEAESDDIDPAGTSATCDKLALEFAIKAAEDCELVLEESDTAFDYRPANMSEKEFEERCEYLVRQGVLVRNEDKDTDEPYLWNDITDGLEAFAKRVIKTKKEMKAFLKGINVLEGDDMANRLLNFEGEAGSEANSEASEADSDAESDAESDCGQIPMTQMS